MKQAPYLFVPVFKPRGCYQASKLGPCGAFRLLGTWFRHSINCDSGDYPASSVNNLPEGIIHVSNQVEPVGDLYCARCGAGHSLRIRSSAVPGNYLNAWMLANPLCYRLRRTPREYVHRPTGLKVTQKGAVGSAASDGESSMLRTRGALARQ